MKKHLHYDAADLPAIEKILPQVIANLGNIQLREDNSIFLAREFDRLRAKIYEIPFPDMTGLSLIPMSSEAQPYDDYITTQYYDSVGMAKIVANYADDLPRADVEAKKEVVKIHDIGASYGYNHKELEKSLATNRNLPELKAKAAHRAILTKLNDIALNGDKQYGIYGLNTHPNMGVTTIPSQKDWLTDQLTATEMVADIGAVIEAVAQQSNGIHHANKVVIPSKCFALLRHTPMPHSDKSVLMYLKEEYSNVTFVEAFDFNGAGENGYSQMYAGEFDVDNIKHDVPRQFLQLPAEYRNLEIVVNCLAASAGVTIHYPLAFTSAELSAKG